MIIKGSRLTKATPVYRGMSSGRLPSHFYEKNEDGVCGGVELGFSSTTEDCKVAQTYAAKGKESTLIEVLQGMVDRGCNIGWLSQFSHEKEILFPPLMAFMVVGTRVDKEIPRTLIVEARFTLNMLSLTLDKVISKRRKLISDMKDQMKESFIWSFKKPGSEWTRSGALNNSNATDTMSIASYAHRWVQGAGLGTRLLKHAGRVTNDGGVDDALHFLDADGAARFLECFDRVAAHAPEYFNKDENLGDSVQHAVALSTILEGWPEGLKLLEERLKRVERRLSHLVNEPMLKLPEGIDELSSGEAHGLLALAWSDKGSLTGMNLSRLLKSPDAVLTIAQGLPLKLQELNLEGCRVTSSDTGQRAMAHLCSVVDKNGCQLVTLNLNETELAEASAHQLADALAKNTSLKKVYCPSKCPAELLSCAKA